MKSREELVEVMARVLAGRGAWHWDVQNHMPPFDGSQEREMDRQCVTEILHAIEQNNAVVVPVVATEAMIDAADGLRDFDTGDVGSDSAYTAMLSASPFKAGDPK